MNVTTKTVADDNRYHVSLSPDSKIIRFYVWLYDADTRYINTCKLFWAYVFAPLMLLLVAVAKPASWIVIPIMERLSDWADARRRTRIRVQMTRPAPEPKPEPAGPSRRSRWLENVGNALAAIWLKAQKPLTFIAAGIGVLLAVAAVAGFGYLAVTETRDVLTVLAIIAGCLVGLAIILLIVFTIDQTGFGGKMGDGLRSFGRVMKAGFHSVHDHTCALVDLQEKKS